MSTSSRGPSRNPVSEKYYDCLQCAEQCRHTNPSGVNAGNNAKKIRNNINSKIKNNNNNSHNSLNKNSGQKKEGGKSRRSSSGSNTRRISTESTISSKSLVLHKNSKSLTSGGCFRVDEYCKRKKNIVSSGKQVHQKKIVSKGQQLTPAKKRSSLARPVRVHDSFVQPKRPMTIIECHSHQVTPNPRPSIQRQPNSQDSGTTACDEGLDERIDNENAWPIRLRLEEMLELTLSRGKRNRRMRTRKRKKIVLTSKYGHFKDTERLLKVLSVNNVDQDNRYNVKRCSVM